MAFVVEELMKTTTKQVLLLLQKGNKVLQETVFLLVYI
jgi:hypothetical protein